MTEKKWNILIVDDIDINLDILRNILQNDYQLMFAINGIVALKITERIRPDLILLDIMMPEMDGFETCRRLKESPETRDIPIIFLTAKSEIDDIVEGFKLGAVDYVTKPFRKEELAVRLKTHLKLRETENALRIALNDAETAKDRAETALKKNLEMQKKINDDLTAGAAIQKKFLTSQQFTADVLHIANFNLSVYNRPYTSVSGDFFYPRRLNSGSVGLFFADTCGHGLPAALISMRILGLLQSLPAIVDSPSEYLHAVNRDIKDVMPSGRFIAASYLMFYADGTVRISNSGQPYPILVSDGNVTEICLPGSPIGILPELRISNIELHMHGGDRLILYSDGMTDIRNPNGETLGKERLLTCVKDNAFLEADAIKDQIICMVDEFIRDSPPNDDMTMIIVDYRGVFPAIKDASGKM